MKEREPYRRIINTRIGNLSQQTELNKALADRYMDVSDMRRNVYIFDSTKPPTPSAVPVSSDTLASKGELRLHLPDVVKFDEDPLFSLECTDDSWKIQVHEQVIDEKVRATEYKDRDEYNERFRTMLNQAIKGGLSKSLFHEKMGSDQLISYIYDGAFASIPFFVEALTQAQPQMMVEPGASVWMWAYSLNISVNAAYRLGADIYRERNFLTEFPQLRKNWPEVLLPMIPIDKYLCGKYFLLRHGNNLIIPK